MEILVVILVSIISHIVGIQVVILTKNKMCQTKMCKKDYEVIVNRSTHNLEKIPHCRVCLYQFDLSLNIRSRAEWELLTFVHMSYSPAELLRLPYLMCRMW